MIFPYCISFPIPPMRVEVACGLVEAKNKAEAMGKVTIFAKNSRREGWGQPLVTIGSRQVMKDPDTMALIPN